ESGAQSSVVSPEIFRSKVAGNLYSALVVAKGPRAVASGAVCARPVEPIRAKSRNARTIVLSSTDVTCRIRIVLSRVLFALTSFVGLSLYAYGARCVVLPCDETWSGTVTVGAGLW